MNILEESGGALPGVNETDARNINHEENINSINRINNVEYSEECGVYFADGLRKIDLILAYEGNCTSQKIINIMCSWLD